MTAALLQKINFYKKVLYVLYFLCSVSLCASLTLNIYYFTYKNSQFKEMKELSFSLRNALQVQDSKQSLEKATEYSEKIKDLESSVLSLQAEIFITLLCIIMFGLIGPFIFIQKIKKKIKALQQEIEEQIQIWVRGWMHEYRAYGEDAYQNSEFWLKIILLTVEQLAQYHPHPALFMGAQVARIVRSELDKTNPA